MRSGPLKCLAAGVVLLGMTGTKLGAMGQKERVVLSPGARSLQEEIMAVQALLLTGEVPQGAPRWLTPPWATDKTVNEASSDDFVTPWIEILDQQVSEWQDEDFAEAYLEGSMDLLRHFVMKYRQKGVEEIVSVLERAAAGLKPHLRKPLFADFYRLYGDLLALLLEYKPRREVIELASRSKKFYKKTLKIDGKNALAYIGLGMHALYAPVVAGGSPALAIEIYDRAGEYDDRSYVLFLRDRGKIAAYKKLGKKEEALKVAQQLVVRFPHSQTAREIEERIER